MPPDGTGVRAAPGARAVAGCVVLMGSPCQGMRIRGRGGDATCGRSGRGQAPRFCRSHAGRRFAAGVHAGRPVARVRAGGCPGLAQGRRWCRTARRRSRSRCRRPRRTAPGLGPGRWRQDRRGAVLGWLAGWLYPVASVGVPMHHGVVARGSPRPCGSGLSRSVLMTVPIWPIRCLGFDTLYHNWTVYRRTHGIHLTRPAPRHPRPRPGGGASRAPGPGPRRKNASARPGGDRRGRDRPGRHPRTRCRVGPQGRRGAEHPADGPLTATSPARTS